MKGDFSRIRFTPKKQYTAVLEQQGRVSLDADANEQCAIDGYLRRTEAVDVVGDYGAPVNDAGFAITVAGNQILIGKGRYYVKGLMCENTQDNLAYGSQAYLIGPSPADSTLLSELQQKGGNIQVFLQVWQRLVTALDDPCLREPALGQADTTARLQTVWRVVAAFVPPAVTGPLPPVRLSPGTISLVENTSLISENLVLKNPASLNLSPNLIKEFLATSRFASSSTSAAINLTTPSATPTPETADCCTQMYNQATPTSTGTMAAMTGSATGDCTCQPIPAAGYQGLENELYRVEIHHGGNETQATFKWSRENGSVVAAILSLSGTTVWVSSIGPDANLGFKPNDWVEISDDTYLFGQTPNQPGTLYQILSVDPTGSSLTLTTPATSVDPTRNARVRRWDQSGTSASTNGISLAVGTWPTLENGIQINFGPGTYQSGDYWTIPARTASGQIDWPPCGSDGNPLQLPTSVNVFNAPLACIHWDTKQNQPIVESCRKIFFPLTDLTPEALLAALHITNYSWQNDDITTFDLLLKSGLTVALDTVPTGPMSGANFIVTIETSNTSLVPDFSARRDPLELPAYQVIPLNISILDWQVTVDPSKNQIVWALPKTDLTSEQFRFLRLTNNLLGAMADLGLYARTRVELRGDSIFAQGGNNTQSFLDGQSFGQQATRQDGKTPCIALQMPSGNGAKASDFEGWFYLAPFNDVAFVNMNFSALTVTVGANGAVTGVTAGGSTTVTPQVTINLRYPAVMPAGVTVSLLLSAVTAGVIASNFVSLAQTSIVIPQGSSSATVNINVFGNPGLDATGKAVTDTFQITATAELAYGIPEAPFVTFTLTGVSNLKP